MYQCIVHLIHILNHWPYVLLINRNQDGTNSVIHKLDLLKSKLLLFTLSTYQHIKYVTSWPSKYIATLNDKQHVLLSLKQLVMSLHWAKELVFGLPLCWWLIDAILKNIWYSSNCLWHSSMRKWQLLA